MGIPSSDYSLNETTIIVLLNVRVLSSLYVLSKGPEFVRCKDRKAKL